MLRFFMDISTYQLTTVCCICSLVSKEAVTLVGTNFIEASLLTSRVPLCAFINIYGRGGMGEEREMKEKGERSKIGEKGKRKWRWRKRGERRLEQKERGRGE